jgi:hypothetical protein
MRKLSKIRNLNENMLKDYKEINENKEFKCIYTKRLLGN